MAWEELAAILEERRKEAATDPPIACPNDGEPLQVAADGGLYCPFDGWRPGHP